MTKHIRADLSDRHAEMMEAVKAKTGIDKTVSILEHLITNAYYRYCYSSSFEDVKVKASLVLLNAKNLSILPAKVERVSFSSRAVQIWTVDSGEPYVVSAAQWE